MLGSRVNPLPRLRLSRLLLVGVVLSASARAQGANAQVPQNPPLSQEFDLPSYEAELDRYATEIKLPETIPQLRGSLPRIWFVRTIDGRMDISTAWLAQRLEKLENDPAKSNALVSEIGTRLAAMRESAKEMEAASQQPSANSAREQYKKIMQRSEFVGQQGPSQWDRMWDKIGQWISAQFLKLMRALHLGRASGNVLAWIVVGLAFLALAYFVYRNLEGRARLPESANEASPDLPDPRQWARDALAAAERGDYREAVHCAYWASIVRLESLGLLKRDRARTPRESLRLLDPHPSEQKILREFTRHFELIWYGYRPASAQDWSDARAHLEKMGCLAPSTLATANS